MTEAWSRAGLEQIARTVAERTGLGVAERPSQELEHAARRAMQRAGVAEPEEFARSIAQGGVGWDELIEEFTIRETYFYRTPEHFELARTRILPALRALRGPDHGLHVWSAGCASGEEAYSLAMLLDQENMLATSHVHGSDLCERALIRARTGRYRDWSLRGLDPALSRMYLRTEGTEKVVREALRTRVTFSCVNLAGPEPGAPAGMLGAMDLVFCRNVLIYFDAQTNARVERGLYAALAPGGWLITGPSDPVLGTHAPFEVITTEHGLLYHKPVGGGRQHVVAPAQAHAPHRLARGRSARPAGAFPSHPKSAQEMPAVSPTRASAPERAAQSPEAIAAEQVRKTWRTGGTATALAACDRALTQHVLHAELHYLRALALMDLGCRADAVSALRRCLYLDRSLVAAHFTLGALLRQAGDDKGARTAYRNVLERCGGLAPDALVPLGDGLRVATVTEAAARSLLELEEHS